MATKTAAVKTKNEVAVTKDNLPSGALLAEMQKYANLGLSSDIEDNLVPLIYILQPLSPQVDKTDDRYIKGAEASDIWLKGAETELIKGDVGILFQLVWIEKVWIEWVPRDSGGGYVGVHEKLPDDAREVRDPQSKKVRFMRPNGNEVIHTRQHAGLVLTDDGEELEYVIPMSSSGHTASRGWMTDMRKVKMPDGSSCPIFGALWRLRTHARKNNLGRWFTWDVEQEGFVPDLAALERGYKLHMAFAEKKKVAENPQHFEPAGSDDDDSKPM